NLQVTLSSDSPYITIDNNTISVGSMATMAESDNFQSPFQVNISPETPINTVVAFRFGFTDGNYNDYQYFEMVVNPDYHTLNANSLHVTVNSKGNLAYNGLEFSQGDGIHYKGSSPILFEGGLMVGISPSQVSDNLRNANWKNDNDFTPLQHARISYDIPLAAQEVR